MYVVNPDFPAVQMMCVAGLVVSSFTEHIKNPEIAIQVAAIRALTEVIRGSEQMTTQGLLVDLKAAAAELQARGGEMLGAKASVALAAGCELLLRYVTRTAALEYSLTVRTQFVVYSTMLLNVCDSGL